MKRLFFLSCILVCSLYSKAQSFSSTVVDARTHQPLPFASIYADAQHSTITNAEGMFSLACDSDAVLHISYVGYSSVNIPAMKLNSFVELKAQEMGLQEITVEPISNLIKKTTKETLKQLQKNRRKKANFFYRQTAYTDSMCYEFAEAFLSGKSAAWLNELELLTGRYAGIRPDSLHNYSFYSNFFTFSQIELAMDSRTYRNFGGAISPLSQRYQEYYDVDYEVIRDGETRLFAVHFTPKPSVKIPIYDVTLYIDEKTRHVRKMEGIGRNTIIVHREYVRKNQFFIKEYLSTDFSFIVNMTEEHGFLEVQSVYVSEQHELHGKLLTTHSLLFNIGDKKMGKGEKMGFYGDLHNNIEIQGYDQQFWRKNEIVLRTPVEQQVVEMLENNKLFGVFR